MSNANFDVSVSDRFTGLIFPNFTYHAHIIHCTQKEKIVWLIHKGMPSFYSSLLTFDIINEKIMIKSDSIT